MTKSIFNGIVGGRGLLQKFFGRYDTLTGAKEYLKQPRFPNNLLNDIYEQVCENYKNGQDSKSLENWRFRLLTDYDEKNNKSQEKILEKEIAKWAGKSDRDNWANQVPTASGLCYPAGNTHCNIDIIHKKEDGIFDFFELKIKDKNPLFAAIEIMRYSLLYLFYRKENLSGGDPNLLCANKVNLKVAAPSRYYDKYKGLCVFEEMLSQGMLDFSARFRTQITFVFEYFPWEEEWDLQRQVQSFIEQHKRLCLE